jgi:hypothetical protein
VRSSGRLPAFHHPLLPSSVLPGPHLASALAGTDWDAVTAWATIVVAAGLVAAAIGAFIAARQLQETRKGRYSSLFMEMARAWDEDDLIAVRQSVKGMDPSSFRDHYFSETAQNSKAFYELLKLGNLFEYLGILEGQDGLELRLVDTALGNSVVFYWELYEVAINEEARGWPDFYKNWRELAGKLRAQHPTRPKFF